MFKKINKIHPEYIGPCNIGERGPKGTPGLEKYDITNLSNEINNLANIGNIKEPIFIKNISYISTFDKKGPIGTTGKPN